VLAARSGAKGREAVARLKAARSDAAVEFRTLDLADLGSVRAFAAGIVSDGVAVDVLVNNAGVMYPPRRLTRQGFESQFATNHLGHFALTACCSRPSAAAATPGGDGQLGPSTRAARSTSTISAGSAPTRRGASTSSPSSPTCCSLWSWTVPAGGRDSGALGAGSPRLREHEPAKQRSDRPDETAAEVGNRLFAQSAEMGALCELYAAVDPAQRAGVLCPGGFGEMRGYPTEVQPVASATNEETARRLWEVSEKLTGVTWTL